MAFCPHCGKSVTEQAAKCAACNGELEPRGKAARFKGTMMMSPGTAPLIQPPNAGQPRNTAPAAQPAAADAAAPPRAASVPSGTAATMPMPATGPIAEAAAAATAKKPAALKATMMGTGDGGLADILKKVQQPAPAPAAAVPAAAAPTPLPTPMPSDKPEASPYTPPPREPAAATRREVQTDEDSKRFLVGDPMAPKGGEVPSVAPKAQRNVPRISEEISELPKDRSATIVVVGIIGVCVIAAIGYVAAKLMGLTN